MRKIFKKGIKVSAIIAALMCSTVCVTETAYSTPIDEVDSQTLQGMSIEEQQNALFEMIIRDTEEHPDLYGEGATEEAREAQRMYNGQSNTGGGTETAPSEGTSNPATDQPTKPAEKPTACDHDYESVTTKQPTCAEEGELVKTCTKCGNKITETIPKTEYHKYTQEITKQPTCTADGEKTFTCGVCGDTYTEAVPASGHHYGEEITTAATCTTDGVKTFKCRDCEDNYTEAIPATGHETDNGTVTKEAGWFTAGTKEYRCAACNEVLNTETIPSQYPIWVLYAAIGIVAAIVIAVVAVIIIRKKKTSGSATGKAKAA